MVLGLNFARVGIGFAVRERMTAAAAICHGVCTQLAHAGALMAELAPDLYLAARGLPEHGVPRGLFDYEPSAASFERPGGFGRTVMLHSPIRIRDDSTIIFDRGVLLCNCGSGQGYLARGNAICIRSATHSP